MAEQLEIRRTGLDHPDVAGLNEIVQDYYRQLYGGPDTSPMEPDAFAPPQGGFILGYRAGDPVAMGGWRFLPGPGPLGMARPVEIKRMFVRPEARGRGFGAQILQALEQDAAAAGAGWILLQTGAPQAAAVALYRRAGYRDVPAFGHYASKAGVLHLGRPTPPIGQHPPLASARRAPRLGGMANEKKIAFLVAAEGIEKAELVEPWAAVEDAGHQPVLLSPDSGTVQLFEHLDKADTRPVDEVVSSVSVDDFDALVLPGGVANPDALRTDEAAVAFVRDFVDSGKPVAAICHAPWTLIEAGVLRGRRLTSWPSLRTDVGNAGGEWVDEQVVVDGNLITSRNPGDIPAFNSALLESVNHGVSSAASSVS